MRRFAVVLLALLTPAQLIALERVTVRYEGRETVVSGEVLVTAQDGGLLVMAADGTLWTIEPDDLVSRKTDSEPFEPLSRDGWPRNCWPSCRAGFDVYSTTTT